VVLNIASAFYFVTYILRGDDAGSGSNLTAVLQAEQE
jgi:hypothetical protein